MKFILTFDHSAKTNGASKILEQIIKIIDKKQNLKNINFIFSAKKGIRNKKCLFTLDNSYFFKSFFVDFCFFTVNLFKIVLETKKL